MSEKNIIYFPDRIQWRNWLEAHFMSEKEIWLVFPKKSSGKPAILYNDAVEEALCFGWIDSTVKSYDPESKIQRFSPRNNKSSYSQQNIERLRHLKSQNLLHPSVEAKIADILRKEYIFPDDIMEQLKKDHQVWENFNQFSDVYKRIRIAYIDGARSRPEEFKKRLDHFIKKTRQNKTIGYGGIDKYY